jgi:type VI protein secretion system component VasF
MARTRPPGTPSPRKIFVTLPEGARRLFDQLVSRKFYGEKDAEVARYLVIAKLDELVEKGRLVETDAG